MFFILCACDVTELFAPEAETTAEETSVNSETTTKEETTNQSSLSHTECEYCGQLEGENRWFIGTISNELMINPKGNDCFEAKAAGYANIHLHYNEVDGDTEKKLKAGDIVKVEYNGMIMETFPVQIGADKVTVIGYEDPKNANVFYDYNVNYGTLIVKSGENEVCPLEGFVYSSSEVLEADGAGIYFYLDAIFDGKISDEDMPVLYLDGELDVDLSSNNTLTVKYINPATKKETYCKLRQLSELQIGQYYVVLGVVTKDGNSSYCYEYIFKLIVEPEEPPTPSNDIKDYIVYENEVSRLMLPLSRIKLSTYSCDEYLNLIDVELLTQADDIFTGGRNKYPYGLFLGFDDENYLCLCNETICDSDDEIGHSHSIEKIRITKEPCK